MTVVVNEQHPPSDMRRDVRTVNYVSPRPRWPGLLLLAVVVAGVTALAVSNYYDRRSPGEKIDATVQELRDGANVAAQSGGQAADRAAEALADTGITAAVKTALAADPSLSMLKIEVSTEAGVVSLAGPAPDERSRERAAVLAAAPAGVVRVDNRLVVSPPAAAPPR
jgi:hyperosmotically inducible periplasmic protein